MAPRGTKRKSDQSTASGDDYGAQTGTQKVAIKSGQEESPRKKRKVGISLSQKQALIDNLQLEITERARKLRANCNLHAQTLRTRIEIRVNRIPLALRNIKMGDLLAKYSGDQQHRPGATAQTAAAARLPPVPEKDASAARSGLHNAPSPTRPQKISAGGGDKENESEKVENPKKRLRGGAAIRGERPGQVLSPASSNSRIVARGRVPAPSPGKSLAARPASPTKPGSSSNGNGNILSNMVDKARSTRAAATARKATTSSTASSSAGSTHAAAAPAPAPAAARTRRAAAATATTTAASARSAPSRTGRRVSNNSESSDGSTSTVVRKRVGAGAPAAASSSRGATQTSAAKRTVMGTLRKGVTGGTAKKAPTKRAAAAPSATGTGRVLRKRA